MKDLKQIEKDSLNAIAAVEKTDGIEEARVQVLGRKSDLTLFLRTLKDLPEAERKKTGALANNIRVKLELALEDKLQALLISNAGSSLEKDKIDVTLPGIAAPLGHVNPLMQTQNEVYQIFSGMGFELAQGPEIESEKYNFDMLNIPADHPARDMWDTFFIKDKQMLLRTHTSPVQIRYMEGHKPPFRIFAPGRTFRYEQIDASHLPNFYQCEGLVVGKGIRMSDLKGTVEAFLSRFFKTEVKVRMRQSYFPFTEPSVEFDMSCTVCKGSDAGECKVCKGGKWLEIMGAGMVHPQVLRNVGIDPEEFSGFAFGMGLDRLCMLKHGIDDIRLNYGANLKFLNQF